jgi:hypothetical protein
MTKNENLSFMEEWMHLENIIVSEKNIERQIIHDLPNT